MLLKQQEGFLIMFLGLQILLLNTNYVLKTLILQSVLTVPKTLHVFLFIDWKKFDFWEDGWNEIPGLVLID